MKKRFNSLGLGVAAAFVVFMLAPPAHATLEVQLSGGTTCIDNAACDSNPTVGIIAWNNVMDGVSFTIDGSTTTSESPIGALSLTMNGTPSAPSTFTITMTDNGFTTPPPPLIITQDVSGLSAAVGGPLANFSAVGYFSPTNALFDTSGPHTGTATTSVNSAAGVSSSGQIFGSAPYGLTSVVTVNLTNIGAGPNHNLQVNADLTASAVPEPASVVLLGGVLLLTVGAIRRKVSRA